MTLRLAAEARDELAAVACMGHITTVGPDTLDAYPLNKDKLRLVPTLRIHGTFDFVIPNSC